MRGVFLSSIEHLLLLSLRGILVILLISTVLLLLTSCQKENKVLGPPEKITIAYATSANAILVYIAFANGYFAEEGLDAIPQPHAFGKLALGAVIDGRANLGTSADTPLVFAVMNGKRITTLATIQTSNMDLAIVARNDRGIASPGDLKGKKLGVTLGTNADFFADAFLLDHGIDREKVKIIDMKPDEMADALGAGRVDAVATFNPTLTLLKKELGNKGTVFFYESIYTENFCITGMQDYATKHPETIKKVLRALIKAETFVHQHPAEARHLVADFIKVDKVLLDEIWPIFVMRVTLDQALLVDLEDQTRWLLKGGLTVRKDMPNYFDFIYTEGLLAVKPEAVRILR
jgi:NitT/TauT family transport system substrate-binding protein